MKLYSPAFEKKLKCEVKAAIKLSPELTDEYRRAKKYRRHYSSGMGIRLAASILGGGLVYAALTNSNHALTGLATLALLTFCLAFTQASSLWSVLYNSNDLPALLLLPIDTAGIFRWEIQKFFRKSFWWIFDFTVGLSVVALYLHWWDARWFAIVPLAVLSWIVMYALVIHFAFFVPRSFYVMANAGLIGCGFLFFIGWRIIGPPVLYVVDHFAQEILLLLPTGWVGSLLALFMPNPAWATLFILGPALALIWLGRKTTARLCENYKIDFIETASPIAKDIVPGAQEPSQPTPLKQESPTLGLSEIEGIIQNRTFLAPPLWPEFGWLEARLWQWLNPRERTLSEFVFPGGLVVTRMWKKIYKYLGWSILAVCVSKLINPIFATWAFYLGLIFTLPLTLGLMLNSGLAFRPVANGGVNIPSYAGFPIGYRELSRLLVKCSVIQMPCLILLTLSLGGIGAYLGNWTLREGIALALKVSGLLLALRFGLLVFAFSNYTNDVRSSRFFLLPMMILFALIFLGTASASLFVPNQIHAWLFLVAAGLDAYASFRFYGWYYSKNRFDLMAFAQ